MNIAIISLDAHDVEPPIRYPVRQSSPRRDTPRERLMDDTDFCRKCFDAIMSGQYDGLSYMGHPKFMVLA